MGYKTTSYYLTYEQKAFLFLMREFGFSIAQAQRIISKNALICNKKLVTRAGEMIQGDIELSLFEPKSKGLKAIFGTKDFAIFDKPTSMLVHPKGKTTDYSLLDEVKISFGNSANITHRIDFETSGLVLVSKNLSSEVRLKKMFEKKEIKKRYIALVSGKINGRRIINHKIAVNMNFESLKERVLIDDMSGKEAITYINPLHYYKEIDASLLEVFPITGRTHQIRVHLNSISHPILGEPLYGQSFEVSSKYLDKEITKEERIKYTRASRLMLHSDRIEFSFDNVNYNLNSISKDFYIEIENIIKSHQKGNL